MTRRVDYLVGGEDFKGMTAGQFMESDVVFYARSSKADKLATAMTAGGFGSIPVVDKDRKLVGIVSEFDLLKALRDGKNLAEITAGEIMNTSPISVTEEIRSEELMKVLEEKHLIRVPVTDENGRLVGVAARRDVLQGYLRSRGEQQPWWM